MLDAYIVLPFISENRNIDPWIRRKRIIAIPIYVCITTDEIKITVKKVRTTALLLPSRRVVMPWGCTRGVNCAFKM